MNAIGTRRNIPTDQRVPCIPPLSQHGLAGCICQFALILQPEWRKVSTNPVVRCENGDPFDLLAAQLDTLIINWAESGINWLIDEANTAINNIAGGANEAVQGAGDVVQGAGGVLSQAGQHIQQVFGGFFGRRMEEGTNGRRLQDNKWNSPDLRTSGPIPHYCYPNPHQRDKCTPDGPSEADLQHQGECMNPSFKKGLDLTCYYHRVRACTLTTHNPC